MSWEDLRWLLDCQSTRALIDKRKWLACVFVLAAAYLFPPERLKPARDLFALVLLLWLAAISYDIYKSSPPFIQEYVHGAVAGPVDAIKKLAAALSWWTVPRTHQSVALGSPAAYGQHVVSLQRLRAQTGQTRLGDSPPQPPDDFQGLLVRLDPAPCAAERRGQQGRAVMPWTSYDTSMIPGLAPVPAVDDHLSLCLVPRTIWSSCKTTVREKMKAARIWSKDTTGIGWLQDATFAESELDRIIGVEDLGLAANGSASPAVAHQYANVLSHSFGRNKVYWSSIDYAALLAAMVIGPTVHFRCNKILRAYDRVRGEPVLNAREDSQASLTAAAGSAGRWSRLRLLSSVSMVISGTALAPILLPASVDNGLASPTMNEGSGLGVQARQEACGNLVTRLPQLGPVLEGMV